LILAAETVVVTTGTVRIIFVTRGRKMLAAALAFFEVSLWLFAIGQIMQNLSDLRCYLAFAGGCTAGNFFGVLVEQQLGYGHLVVRVITARGGAELAGALRGAGYGVTTMEGRGSNGHVEVVLTVIARKCLSHVRTLIEDFDPHAFYSVDEVQAAAQGIFPTPLTSIRARTGWRSPSRSLAGARTHPATSAISHCPTPGPPCR
jgi:uncharacterized protein YebE (UPF0316 family)